MKLSNEDKEYLIILTSMLVVSLVMIIILMYKHS